MKTTKLLVALLRRGDSVRGEGDAPERSLEIELEGEGPPILWDSPRAMMKLRWLSPSPLSGP